MTPQIQKINLIRNHNSQIGVYSNRHVLDNIMNEIYIKDKISISQSPGKYQNSIESKYLEV